MARFPRSETRSAYAPRASRPRTPACGRTDKWKSRSRDSGVSGKTWLLVTAEDVAEFIEDDTSNTPDPECLGSMTQCRCGHLLNVEMSDAVLLAPTPSLAALVEAHR